MRRDVTRPFRNWSLTNGHIHQIDIGIFEAWWHVAPQEECLGLYATFADACQALDDFDALEPQARIVKH